MGPHLNRLIEAVQTSSDNICFGAKIRKQNAFFHLKIVNFHSNKMLYIASSVDVGLATLICSTTCSGKEENSYPP